MLAIDTSTPTVTAGVVRLPSPHELIARATEQADGSLADGPSAPGSAVDVLAERTVTDAFGHAEYLMPLVTAALAHAGHAIGDMAAVVVGIGPGPFTGLRVGMATAAALGDALDIPVHGVPSHDAAARCAGADGDFLVVTDARRREVYLSAYSASVAQLHGPVVIAPAAVPDLLAARGLAPRFVSGAGAGLVADVLGVPIRPGSGQLAGALVECAARPLLTGALPGPLAPMYLRRPDATEPSAPKSVLPPAEPAGTGR